MKTLLTFVLLSLCGLLVVVTGEDTYGQVYCGRRLATTLALLCDNTLLLKRTETGVGGYDWPWIGPRQARSLSRSKRQVVSECCEKPCTIDELLSYC
ncbi:unnamed protein product [Parnassius apollo]|uniref:(apollo) hypothetical protein n=1 Tax=Parnassius apollo TaxID=110799 RepID=A0A8S3W4J1_PARAO|nr:unnamed protein product [Parnassius apollo]